MELEKIRAIAANALHCSPEKIGKDTSFTEELHADSLELMKILVDMEELFDIPLEEGDMKKLDSLGDAASVLARARKRIK
ncbi:MAG: acyl carrier protein [Lachnospiraceae bacterium]|nr:acyl carrier protein [Lachnospiraceae bacterium]